MSFRHALHQPSRCHRYDVDFEAIDVGLRFFSHREYWRPNFAELYSGSR